MGRACGTVLVLILVAALAAPATANSPMKDPQTVGQPAGMFVIDDIAGGKVSLEELLKSHDAVVLNFWGLRCGACIEEMPYLEAIRKKVGERVVFLGVNVDAVDGATLKEQMARMRLAIGYAVIPDPDFKVVDLYKMTAAPLTVVVDRAGKVRYRHENFVPGDEKGLEEAIRAVLPDGAVVAK